MAGCLPKPFLLLDADGLWMVGRDSMSLELEALSFRVMVESDLNVDGMLIEPAREIKRGRVERITAISRNGSQ